MGLLQVLVPTHDGYAHGMFQISVKIVMDHAYILPGQWTMDCVQFACDLFVFQV